MRKRRRPAIREFEKGIREGRGGLDLDGNRGVPVTDEEIDFVAIAVPEEVQRGGEAAMGAGFQGFDDD